MYKPNHRELLPLLFEQPFRCLVLFCFVAIVACFFAGVATAAYAAWQVHGFGYFLPSTDTCYVVLFAAFGMAAFNIAHASVRIDVEQGRDRQSGLSAYLTGLAGGFASIACSLLATKIAGPFVKAQLGSTFICWALFPLLIAFILLPHMRGKFKAQRSNRTVALKHNSAATSRKSAAPTPAL